MAGNQYILKHKDINVAAIELDEQAETLIRIEPITPEAGPFLGNVTKKNMSIWWKNRSIPGDREDIESVLEKAGCENSGEYLAKNLALSLTDSYWICPVGLDAGWEDVNLYRNYTRGSMAVRGSSYDPNSSLGGQMKKYWDFRDGKYALVKMGEVAYGQQSINEVIATEFHSMQGLDRDQYVKYQAILNDAGNCIGSECPAFTDEKYELISAYEIICSRKQRNDQSSYETFVSICEENGIDRCRDFMEYMLMSDFILNNTDRHMNNIGVIRDSESLKIVGMAPIYDTGNSMFWNKSGKMSRMELLEQDITGFAGKYEKLMSYVRKRNIINSDRILMPDGVYGILERHGVPDVRSEVIADNYSTKLEMFHEFQQGKKLSLYYEKKTQQTDPVKECMKRTAQRFPVHKTTKRIEH